MLSYNQFETLQYSNKLNVNIFNNLINHKCAGVVIKNFFNSSEIYSLLKSFSEIKENKRNPFNGNEGVVFPESFSVLAKNSFNENEMAEILPKGNKELFEVLNTYECDDYQDKLFNLFSEIGEGYSFVNATLNGEILKNEKAYFTTLRELYQNGGGIRKHCEKDLQVYYNKFIKLLGLELPHFQLSYFILLNKPIEGGKLKIHNQYFFTNMANEKETEFYIPEIEEGDLVIFNGGEIYHSVSNIIGSENRITIGGFLSKKNNNFYSWS